MRFVFPKEVMISKPFDLDALTQLIYKKKFNYIKNYINHVAMAYLFNSDKLPIESGKEINELYVIRIKLNRPGLPLEFIKRLDAYIEFPVLYWLCYKDHNNYILPVFNKDKEKKGKPSRILYTGWLNRSEFTFDTYKSEFKSVDDIYKNIMLFMSGMESDVGFDFTIKDYINQLKKVIDQARVYSGIFDERADIAAHAHMNIDIGSPTFDSVHEGFVSFHSLGDCGFSHSKLVLKYLASLGYSDFSLRFAGNRKFKKKMHASLSVADNIKLPRSYSYLHKEIYAKYDGDDKLIIEEDKCRIRSEDEVVEMKLIYGKYLIEQTDGNTEKDSNEVNDLTKKRKSKQPQRRPMTAEERKKYLGE